MNILCQSIDSKAKTRFFLWPSIGRIRSEFFPGYAAEDVAPRPGLVSFVHGANPIIINRMRFQPGVFITPDSIVSRLDSRQKSRFARAKTWFSAAMQFIMRKVAFRVLAPKQIQLPWLFPAGGARSRNQPGIDCANRSGAIAIVNTFLWTCRHLPTRTSEKPGAIAKWRACFQR